MLPRRHSAAATFPRFCSVPEFTLDRLGSVGFCVQCLCSLFYDNIHLLTGRLDFPTRRFRVESEKRII